LIYQGEAVMTLIDNLIDLATGLEAKRGDCIIGADVQGLTEFLSDDLHFIHSRGLKDGKGPSLLRIFL